MQCHCALECKLQLHMGGIIVCQVYRYVPSAQVSAWNIEGTQYILLNH